MLSSKTLASKADAKAKGYKNRKDRVTIMACNNASGIHKLPLVLIGKSNKPHALNDVNRCSLPVLYRVQKSLQKSAWMDGVIFKNWFKQQFVQKVKN